MESVPVLIITGPVGSGKSTVAIEISEILRKENIFHGMIDIDYLRYAYPNPKDDPYAMRLGYKNLSDIVRNFQKAGMTRFIIPTIGDTKEEIINIGEAIPGSKVVVVRLRGKLETLENNLRKREIASSLEWHLERAKEMHETLESTTFADAVIDIDDKTVRELAEEIIAKSSFKS